MSYVAPIKRAFHVVRRRLKPEAVEPTLPLVSLFREFGEERRHEFLAQGYNQKHPFFPHRVYHLPKAGPDQLKLARRMCGVRDPNKLWEVVVYATSPATDEFPEELFFDDDLIWHQQQFGNTGHVTNHV